MFAFGTFDDPLEREADRIADQVLAMAPRDDAPRAPTTDRHYGTAPVTLARRALAPASSGTTAVRGVDAPPIVSDALGTPGRPLDDNIRRFMEPRFGHDFGHVRVNSGGRAAASAAAVGARAYTVGQDIVFGAGEFAPDSVPGRRLLAHELTHTLQQNTLGVAPMLRRKGFESTVEVCHRVLESRKFAVDHGGVRVVLTAGSPDTAVPNCRDFDFSVSLTRSEDWWPDKEIGTCDARTGGVRVFRFANLSAGTYYLTFWRMFDHPYCCLQGDVMVFDESQPGDGEGCRRAKDLSTMDIVHGALDLAGFIPVLGAIPDGINAGIYVVEGDWVNAGLSAVAALPAVGDGIKAATMGGKAVIKVEAKTAIKLGEEGLAKELKTLKAASKPEGKALKSAEKADAKALDETFQGGKGEAAYDTTNRLKRGNLGERLATDSLAADGHSILSYKPDIRGTNQGGIDMVTLKGDVVYFVDNKALSRSGNVSSVSALTTNFAKNKAAALSELRAALKAAPTQAERDVLQKAITAIEGNKFKKVVTNANLTKDDAILTGVTQGLRDKGIEFIDVFAPVKKP